MHNGRCRPRRGPGRSHRATWSILAAAIGCGLVAATATAGEGDGALEITSSTIDAGGGTSSGGGFTVTGTIGQPEPGPAAEGGGLSITGGFWTATDAGTPCVGDLDGNGAVGFSDLVSVLTVWGLCPGCPADFDDSGDVAFPDLLVLLSAWGPCPG